MTRHARELSPNQVYHIMIRGNEKKNIFLDDEDREKFIYTLRNKKQDTGFELYAYCLMNNHVHLLINEKNSCISKVMKCINISYAVYFNIKYGRVGHLFQDRFKSEIVDIESYLLNVVRYIHNNPVKSGVIQGPADYIWSSYSYYATAGESDELVDVDLVLGVFNEQRDKAIEQFRKFSEKSDEENDEIDYLDCNEDKIQTKPEALQFVQKILNEKGIIYQDVFCQCENIKGSIKHELAVLLKKKSCLGCRDIADILGLSKSTVNRLS